MKPKKIFLVIILLIVLSITGFYLYLRPKYVVPILMYHRIDDRGKTSSLSVSPENFRRQIRFLSEHNYNVIFLSELVQAKKDKKKLPRNTVVITFDDGYENNYSLAYLVLKEYDLAATIFVIVGSIGEKGYLNYEQINQMLVSGLIDIGSHSLGGDYLPGKTILGLVGEIRDSKMILQDEFDRRIGLFCYPIGGFNPQIQELLQKYGYKAACTTNRGNKKTCLNDDIFALKRIKIKDSANPFVLWVKFSGYYNFFRRVRNPY